MEEILDIIKIIIGAVVVVLTCYLLWLNIKD